MEFLKPESIILFGGIGLLLLIVFAETGLFFGFFLPGDSLLFTAGLLCNSTYLPFSVTALIAMITASAVLGTCAGYLLGRWSNQYFEKRKENFLYKKRYIDMARDFYNKRGMSAFFIGRFLPVFRTFIPIIAGVLRIRFTTFLLFNIAGALTWVIALVGAGYTLGKAFPGVHLYLELIVLAMIVITAIPAWIAWTQNKKSILIGKSS